MKIVLAQSPEIIAPPDTGIGSRRGPQTAEGRNAVAKNAIRHGIYSRVAVIERVGQQEDWDAHRGKKVGVCLLAPAYGAKKDRIELSLNALAKQIGAARCEGLKAALRKAAGDRL